jgi:hypothetical protein
LRGVAKFKLHLVYLSGVVVFRRIYVPTVVAMG